MPEFYLQSYSLLTVLFTKYSDTVVLIILSSKGSECWMSDNDSDVWRVCEAPQREMMQRSVWFKQSNTTQYIPQKPTQIQKTH